MCRGVYIFIYSIYVCISNACNRTFLILDNNVRHTSGADEKVRLHDFQGQYCFIYSFIILLLLYV